MIWLLASVIVPFLSAICCLLSHQRPRLARSFGVAGAAVLLGTSLMLVRQVLEEGHVVMQAAGWPAPFGITLVADVLGASMVAITGLIALAAAIYSVADIGDRIIRKHYFGVFHFLLMGVNGAFITGDLFNLYVWFEIMLLASFVLLTMGGGRDRLEGGVKYLVINLVSSALFLSGVGLLYGMLGTLNMADIAVRLETADNAFLVNSSAMLVFVAFSIKSALFPFFFWLPAAYHTPAPVVSALFAGLLTKVGIYALIRANTLFFHTQADAVREILLFLAGATRLTGVLGAAAQYGVRKILSFHIVSQIGYMLMGLAIGTAAALAAAVFYILHHIIVKANLFLIAGLIARRCGTEDLKKAGGLYVGAPGLALLFFIPAFSLGGIPPLSGFWAKFAVIEAGLEGRHYLLVAVALLVGALTLFSMTKIWAEAFWKNAPEARAPTPGNGGAKRPALLLPCAALALLTLGIGLWSGPLFALAQAAGDQLIRPEAYIDAVLGHANPPDYARAHP